MNILIRLAAEPDLKVLTDFNSRMALETENKRLDAETLKSGTRSLLQKPHFGFYLVAEIAGVVVGQLMITYEWSDWRNGVFWWIQSVYVTPENRGRGVYRALHDYVVENARNSGACGVRLYVDKNNASATAVYEKCGMHRAHYDLFELDFVL